MPSTVIRAALAAVAIAATLLVAPTPAQAAIPRSDPSYTQSVPRRGDWFFCTREYVKRDPRCRPAPRRV